MTYKKNFVACIKVNGQILRESHDRVELPFGSEYTILLKNLDTVRMQARISIDGKDATGWLVIEPGRDVEIERFVEDLERGNRFKFIERTARIEEHRGIKVEDGLVRIEFKREKVYEAPKISYHYTYNYPYNGGCLGGIARSSAPFITTTGTSVAGSLQNAQYSVQNVQAMNMACSAMGAARVTAETNEAGITVQGSLSNQRFVHVPDFQTEQAEAIVLQLVGKTAQKIVKVAKTTKIKVSCDTCGKKNKSSAKFCIECGTGLERV